MLIWPGGLGVSFGFIQVIYESEMAWVQVPLSSELNSVHFVFWDFYKLCKLLACSIETRI
jgi:hypothetical protein